MSGQLIVLNMQVMDEWEHDNRLLGVHGQPVEVERKTTHTT